MKIKSLLLVFLIFVIGVIFCDSLLSKFHQNDYKIRNMRIEILHYNKDLINYFEIKTFKYNRTTTAFNGTINAKVDISTEVDLVGQAYKFMSNEYRYFPARARLNACKVIKADVLGITSRVILCGNLTRCFIAKETTYHVCNFTPDAEHLPPNMPTGEFMIEVEAFYFNISLTTVRLYAEVYRPIYPKDKKG